MSKTSPKQQSSLEPKPNLQESSKKLTRQPIHSNKQQSEHGKKSKNSAEPDQEDDSQLEIEDNKQNESKLEKKKEKCNYPPTLKNKEPSSSSSDINYSSVYKIEDNKRNESKLEKKKEKCNYPLTLKNKEPSSSSSDINYSSVYKIVYISLGILVISVSYMYIKYPVRTEVSYVTQVVEDIRNQFKNQHSINYRSLEKELEKVAYVEHEPPAPAIFTLIANKGAANTASEFSQYLAHTLAPSRYLSINDSTYWSGDPDDIKLKIDDNIRSSMEKDHLSVIIVDKIEKIPTEAVMIFHSFCDHELAPFKRAVFLFIVNLDEIIPENANIKHIDNVAFQHLRKIWYTATDDMIDSLIVRMTVSVINIR